MDDRRTLLVEFLTVAAMALLFTLALTWLATSGHDGSSIVETFKGLLGALVGALVALAYAARGNPKPPVP